MDGCALAPSNGSTSGANRSRKASDSRNRSIDFPPFSESLPAFNYKSKFSYIPRSTALVNADCGERRSSYSQRTTETRSPGAGGVRERDVRLDIRLSH